jgi:MFS family permease
MTTQARSMGPAGMSDKDRLYRKVARRLIPILMLCYLMASLDRSNVAFAKLEFSRDLHFDDAIFGIGAGVFALGYLLFEVPSNMLLQRIGVKRTLLRIMTAWGLCCAALAFMVLPWHFYTLRFLLGVAEAGFFPGVIFYLTRWTPMERRARLIALFMSSIAISGVLGGPISGVIMHQMGGVGGLLGWQWLFILEGLPSIAVGLLAFAVLAESPADAKWLTAKEKDMILTDLRADVVREKSIPDSWRSILRMPAFAALAIASFTLMTSTGGAFLWLPTILRNAGVDGVLDIGLYSAIPFLFAALAQYMVARHSDRTQERRLHVAIPFALGSVGWLLAAWLRAEPALAIAAMSLAIAGTFGAMGPFWTLPGKVFHGGQIAVGIAIVTTIGGIGNFISPPIVGYISVTTGSLAAAQLYFAALMLVSATAVMITSRPRAGRLAGVEVV